MKFTIVKATVRKNTDGKAAADSMVTNRSHRSLPHRTSLGIALVIMLVLGSALSIYQPYQSQADAVTPKNGYLTDGVYRVYGDGTLSTVSPVGNCQIATSYAWRNDGKSFVTLCSQQSNMYNLSLVGSDGIVQKVLKTGISDYGNYDHTLFSPTDTNQLLLASNTHSTTQPTIKVMDITTASINDLTASALSGMDSRDQIAASTWTNDGNIAYIVDHQPEGVGAVSRYTLCTIAMDGTKQSCAAAAFSTNTYLESGELVALPSGDYVVSEIVNTPSGTGSTPNYGLAVLSQDGQTVTQLAGSTTITSPDGVAISPDKTLLAYHSDQGTTGYLSTLPINGGAATVYRLPGSAADVALTSWQPILPHKTLPYDFDGNGTDDIVSTSPYATSTNALVWADSSASNTQFGQSGDIPVPGDYNGDGKTDIAIFRPSNGTWYVKGASSNTQFGQSGDIPVPGDYNGDGKTDIAVYRPSDSYRYLQGMGAIYNGPRVVPVELPYAIGQAYFSSQY